MTSRFHLFRILLALKCFFSTHEIPFSPEMSCHQSENVLSRQRDLIFRWNAVLRLKSIAVVANGIKEMPECDWLKIESKLVFKDKYIDGLYRIKEFSRIWVIFGFHRNHEWKSRVLPRKAKDASLVGIFASRGIQRPNHLGLSLVHLIHVEDNTLTVIGLDAFDGSPVYDVKPYDPDYDQ